MSERLVPNRPVEPTAATLLFRAFSLLCLEGLSVGLAVATLTVREGFGDYLTDNLSWLIREHLLRGAALGAGSTLLLAIAWSLGSRKDGEQTSATEVLHLARRLGPLLVTGWLAVMFRVQYWKTHQLEFLVLISLATWLAWVALRMALCAGPLSLERQLFCWPSRGLARIRSAWPGLQAHAPFVVVCTMAAAYVAYFGYTTIAWHWSVRSSFDLAIENNLMWNLVHHKGFFKSTILLGPTGSQFGLHATVISYLFAPLYRLWQRPEMLLSLQSLLMGAAALPLYGFASQRLSRPAAACVAVAYLLYAPLHGANLYEFHYLPLGTFFVWFLVYALETRRNGLAAAALLLSLAVREDVSVFPAVFGLYYLLSGRRPRAGIIVATVSLAYFATMKLGVMPALAGHQAFTFMYRGLLPAGKGGFVSVLQTVLVNPGFAVVQLLEPDKLPYLLQILAPLAFLPLRRPLGLLFLIPGLFFSLFSTKYPALTSIHYQYTTYWTTFVFVGAVVVLSDLKAVTRRAALGALALATLATSYQFGAVLQRQTAYGGPIAYHIGVTSEDRHRHQAIQTALSYIPPSARVSASAFTAPQISSREFAYQISIGVFDAEYLLFPSEPSKWASSEAHTIRSLLRSGQFGVVALVPPFAVARRGHSTTNNWQLLGRR